MIRMIKLMVAGAIVGFLTTTIFTFIQPDEIMGGLNGTLLEIIVPIQIVLIFTLLLPAYVYLSKAKKMLKEVNVELDLDEDQAGNAFDRALFCSEFLSRLFMVLQFVSFGLIVNEYHNFYLLIISFALFLLSVIFAPYVEVRVVRLRQQYDPDKIGDPLALRFSKGVFESYDENEKLKVYKAVFSTFRIMEVVLIIMLLFAIFGELYFKIGKAPIVFIGATWLTQTIVHGYYKKKFNAS